ncbi:MAG: DRTGG domain-containing protein [Thermodesulfovibrionales bacterium]
MTLGEITGIVEALVLTKRADMKRDIRRAYCADLMSDVLAFSVTHALLITGLTNAQVIRTADVADLKAIVFIQGKRPDVETIAMAESKNIPLLVTSLSMFDVCGRLYEKGLRSRSGECHDQER